MCRPMGRNTRPTKGHPVHSTATHPNSIATSKRPLSHAELDSMSKVQQTAEGRYEVAQKNSPGEHSMNAAVVRAICSPNALLSDDAKLASA
eukprot:CAMPEP_0173258680 /NCGR_PEP_ID=MMETSP1142-20121109/24520_1 /TAXON_ID=483371 /ORGANISM="non described non described, Strain CCMP2298" /LENGTH=90 /DNA_ID=CAMNT_0014193067 /DNA_START=357 /DNA_END=629 /DNA_ORIENTATION=+